MQMPTQHTGVAYSDFMAELCRAREVQLYLEVGVQNAINMSKISADVAVGIDPGFAVAVDPTIGKTAVHLYRMTSDAFFRSAHAERVLHGGVDFAFLDGMHLFEYLLRDVRNAERFAKRDGLIALHDCLPFDDEMIERVNNFAGRRGTNKAAWTGDVWKVVAILQKYRPDLEITLLDCYPTGLVMISNLDPGNEMLSANYSDIVREWRDIPNDQESLDRFYADQTILSAADVLKEHSHSLYFKA